MNKYTFLVFHQEYDAFLEELRTLGVLHVKERESGDVIDNSQLQQLMSKKSQLEELQKDMLNAIGNSAALTTGDKTNIEEILSQHASFGKRNSELQQSLMHLSQDYEVMKPWGKIDWKTINMLQESGYEVTFYSSTFIPEEDQKQFNLIEVGQAGSRLLFVAVNPKDVAVELAAEKIVLPQYDIDELEKQVETVQQQIRDLAAEKKQYSINHLADVKHALAHLQDSINFEQVKLNTGAEADKRICLLEGFCPSDKVDELNKMLADKGAWYSCRKVTREDKAPVKLVNNPLVKLFESLTRMYGLPSATDVDPTAILSIFFTLFFAICIADAGYGLILTAMSIADIKMGGKIGKVLFGINFKLVLVLGIACIFVGILFGTAFGIDLSAQSWVPESVKSCMIVGKFPGTNYDKQMILSLLIGIFHISLAMTVNAINVTMQRGFKECLGTWGWWLAVVGTVIVAALTFGGVIPQSMMMTAIWVVLGVAAVGIYLLNNIHRNPLINILAGLYDTYNMASGLMGDILSYIRLYALGLAGGMLGATFNNLAMMSVDNDLSSAGFGIIGFLLIILIGHVLNIAMSCLSAFVHPLRLSFVEYFKNAGYEGKGTEYKPFKVTEE
ncbi:MAG: ATPase V [Bacteroidaceae bacterium]|nr:ATPase V [Bacteroidaceae bacterium]MDO4956947.1 V-type ATPase 116kDa subunit family protein [Bacteroidales bacterium]